MGLNWPGKSRRARTPLVPSGVHQPGKLESYHDYRGRSTALQFPTGHPATCERSTSGSGGADVADKTGQSRVRTDGLMGSFTLLE